MCLIDDIRAKHVAGRAGLHGPRSLRHERLAIASVSVQHMGTFSWWGSASLQEGMYTRGGSCRGRCASQKLCCVVFHINTK